MTTEHQVILRGEKVLWPHFFNVKKASDTRLLSLNRKVDAKFREGERVLVALCVCVCVCVHACVCVCICVHVCVCACVP